jgi:hypothetical protein
VRGDRLEAPRQRLPEHTTHLLSFDPSRLLQSFIDVAEL